MIRLRYEEKKTLQAIGEQYDLSRERVRQIVAKGLRKLRNKARTIYIREGLKQASPRPHHEGCETAEGEGACAKWCREFVFQGMMGNGHLVSSIFEAQERIEREMEPLEPDGEEPLTENISTRWARLNLRAAKAKGMRPGKIAWVFYESAQRASSSFTRQDVYDFCVELDGSEAMKAAAKNVLEEGWLPHHSQQYRDGYYPAYRVVDKDYRKVLRDEENAGESWTDPAGYAMLRKR